jgi:hypothetical protein
MIHHFSIAARDPEHTASVIAELIGGQSLNFSPFPGSRIVIAGDAHGTAVEVYPLGLELAPGVGQAPTHSITNPHPSEFTATHAAISVALDEDSVKRIAQREGWRAVTCKRTVDFQVIEFWLENRLMIEILTPEMARDYLRAIAPENLAAA